MRQFQRAGLRDWWLQRISASILSLYFLPIIFAWLLGYIRGPLQFYQLLNRVDMKLATLAMLIAYTIHSRIGLWVVITDYMPRFVQHYLSALFDILFVLQFVIGAYLIWSF
ncbi:succinate dehydrogenase, hydrophobic membrane anchor protein [Gammaproteobacteria bacterium]|nr:succinate dehydrogenase, hydrophobic membrane anchor protein [Gammaproteobacteria bacterium]